MQGPEDDGYEALAARLKALLRESEPTDAVTSARLSAARARALEARGREVRRAWLWAWAPGGALAAALLVGLMIRGLPDRSAVPAPAPGDALEVLTDDVDPELLEDLEMYRWLAAGDGHA